MPFLPRLTEIFQDGVDCDFAGALTGRLSAHAVADHENAASGIETKVVFVVLANQTYVTFTCGMQRETHVELTMGEYCLTGDASVERDDRNQ